MRCAQPGRRECRWSPLGARRRPRSLGRLRLGQVVRPLLERRLDEVRVLPEVWREVAEGRFQGLERGLDEVALGPGVPAGAAEAVSDAAECEHLLHHRGAHDVRAAGRRDQPNAHRAALAGHLHRYRVREADLVPPIPSPHRDKAQLGCDDAATDGGCDLLGALRSQADVTVVVADKDVANEAVRLACRAHLLHRMDLHHLVLESAWREERVDDLKLLDRQRVQVDVLDGGDLALLDKASELGAGHPLLLLGSLLALLPLLAALLALAVVLSLSKAALTHRCNAQKSTATWKYSLSQDGLSQ